MLKRVYTLIGSPSISHEWGYWNIIGPTFKKSQKKKTQARTNSLESSGSYHKIILQLKSSLG